MAVLGEHTTCAESLCVLTAVVEVVNLVSIRRLVVMERQRRSVLISISTWDLRKACLLFATVELNRLKEYDVVLILRSDMLLDILIHGLKVFFVYVSRYHIVWTGVEISHRGFVNYLVAENIWIIGKCFTDVSPKASKSVLDSVDVVVECLISISSAHGHLVQSPVMLTALLLRWDMIRSHAKRISKWHWSRKNTIASFSRPVRKTFTAKLL